jgi:energy-coupling factor transporter ATP-binding protein EcfA2
VSDPFLWEDGGPPSAQVDGSGPDEVSTGRLIVITGAQAAGKTTLGHAVAGLLPKAVHVDGDAIHGFVVSGQVPYDVPPPPGATEQLLLRYAGAIAVCRVYRSAGFDAVVTDNIFGSLVADVLTLAFADATTAQLRLVVLDPDPDVLQERERERPKTGYTESVTVEMLVSAVREETPRIGLWLDNGDQTVAESAAEIVRRMDTDALVDEQDLLDLLMPG